MLHVFFLELFSKKIQKYYRCYLNYRIIKIVYYWMVFGPYLVGCFCRWFLSILYYLGSENELYSYFWNWRTKIINNNAVLLLLQGCVTLNSRPFLDVRRLQIVTHIHNNLILYRYILELHRYERKRYRWYYLLCDCIIM